MARLKTRASRAPSATRSHRRWLSLPLTVRPLLRCWAAPVDARRRSHSRHPGDLPASSALPSAREGGAPERRAPRAARGRDRPAPRRAAERAAVVGRQVAGSGALHQPVAPPDNPLRAPRDDGGDTATRDSTAWWGLRGPNGEGDGPDRTLVRNRESGSPGPGAVEHVVEPAEWCAFSHRPP